MQISRTIINNYNVFLLGEAFGGIQPQTYLPKGADVQVGLRANGR